MHICEGEGGKHYEPYEISTSSLREGQDGSAVSRNDRIPTLRGKKHVAQVARPIVASYFNQGLKAW